MTSPRQLFRKSKTTRRLDWAVGVFAALLLVGPAIIIAATSLSSDLDAGRLTPNDIPQDVGIEQRIGTQVPLDIELIDELGNPTELKDVTVGKPVLLALVYYQCPMLCNMTMDGELRSLSELKLTAGQDFTAVTVSFDPRESHTLAASTKRTALKRYDRRGAEHGLRFLTGPEEETRRLAEAVGFQYRFDERTGQYAHAAGLVVLTSDGVVSRYLAGVEFPRRDLRLALVEASDRKVGTATDDFLLLCYHYDPTTGRYGLAIMNMLRLAGLLTVVGLASAIVVMLRRDRRWGQDSPTERVFPTWR